MKFVSFNVKGKISRAGNCQVATFTHQAEEDGFVMEGEANDVRQKVVFDGLDDNGQPINPRVVLKTSAEIERDNPKTKPIPPEKRRAGITKGQYQNILSRLAALEEDVRP